ncbi:prepilin-type N-terminal cleavage/methylation domain-containing protein [bacterium]|uniref:Type II secretion system protein GspG C-terminal domain-containing protein n=2 Tax=Katanobacteria TaxID=422282 RepID=A0A2M7X2Z7_UNCKA|nr:prepilin-type N-terminal cleavage/methylation domain-containing protein [bacterium]PIP56487.1 MAG: hypothetical protein COX05_02800 [candidate division WWE3 bacterium CG22_combo_CG10-13_8_21_14_all_39_12]PJA40527.1 MAG: hypothetical protein CO179_02030 [candidate division WWE3 bacterium CG_4_9_14_3_um_filter_39_7]
MKITSRSGFTLIELLVVIVIIGLLAGIGISSFTGALNNAKHGKVVSDLKEIKEAIKILGVQTGFAPTLNSESTAPTVPATVRTCTFNSEMLLNNPYMGLLSDPTGSFYPGWGGPYLESIPLDPWGNQYIYDPDYTCHLTTSGCEGLPDNKVVRGVHSGGPNGSGINAYDVDDIVTVICVP